MVKLTIILSIVVLFIIVFSIDYLFLRDLFWQRLLVNIGIVLVFIVLFFKYIKINELWSMKLEELIKQAERYIINTNRLWKVNIQWG